MLKGPICQRVGRWLCVMLVLVSSGGTAFQLGGCDPEVQSVLLTGVQDLTGTFVDAFFLALSIKMEEENATDGTTGTTGGTGG